MGPVGSLKEIGLEFFLNGCSRPEVYSKWIFSERDLARVFKDLTDRGEHDKLKYVIAQGLYDCYEYPNPSFLTGIFLYYFEEWVQVATAWNIEPYSDETLELWAALETAIILKGLAGFDSKAEFGVRYIGQQYYGLRPGDLRGVVSEKVCVEIQKFLYMREQLLAKALPVWASEQFMFYYSPFQHEYFVKLAQERLADPQYNPLKFCPFDDEECWRNLILESSAPA